MKYPTPLETPENGAKIVEISYHSFGTAAPTNVALILSSSKLQSSLSSIINAI